MSAHLANGFLNSVRRFPDRPAIEWSDASVTYAELHHDVLRVVSVLRSIPNPKHRPFTAVFGGRGRRTFAGFLGALVHGHAYLPINPSFPLEYNREMLRQSGSAALIVEESALPLVEALLKDSGLDPIVVLPDGEDPAEWSRRVPSVRFMSCPDSVPSGPIVDLDIDGESPSYLLFTSGSTGKPKGVVVPHRATLHFLRCMTERYGITAQDRFAQPSQFTFDLSVFDMFVAWHSGACLCCPGPLDLLNPARYLRDRRLTVWFSVPSVANHLKELRQLDAGSLPDLRVSLFAGEPLPASLAETWAAAAPNSIVENLYGPTEFTVSCTLYRWDSRTSPPECENGVVPIGWEYPGMRGLIVDERLAEVPQGEIGELLMGGPQIALGYLDDPERTAAAFVHVPGVDGLFYRTGDRVRRPAGSGPFQYIGRRDHQVKVRGIRVELGEVESVLRDVARVDAAIAIGWPTGPLGAEQLVAFLPPTDVGVDRIRSECRNRLPAVVAPRDIRVLPEFPLNSNGKIDRKALMRILERGS